MDGVITFFSSQQVMKAERVLQKNELQVMLIPGPREISSNCGVALCFEFNRAKEVRSILQGENITFEEIHYYPEAKKISQWVE
jgi:hypothetical protein